MAEPSPRRPPVPSAARAAGIAGNVAAYRTFFEQSSSILLIIDPATGGVVDANQAACDFYGYAFDRLTTMLITEINCLDAEAVAAEMALALAQQRRYFRFPHRLASGEVREVDVYSSPMTVGGRSLLASVIHDISELRRAEAALAEASGMVRMLSRAVEQSPVSVVITDLTGAIEYVNPKFCQVTGYTAAEARGCNPRILKSGITSPEEYNVLWQTITASDTWTGTFANRRKDGEIYWEQAAIGPIRDASGTTTHFLAVKEDITEHRRAAEAMRDSEEKYRLLFEHMTAAFALHEMVYDAEGTPVDYRFLEVNPAFERMTGLSADLLVGKTVLEVLPETEPYWIATYGQVARTGEPLAYQNSSRELHRSYDVFAFRPAPDRFAVVFTDVSERVAAEAALRQSELDFRLLAENSSDLIMRLSPRGTFLYLSPACRTLLGYEQSELIGRLALDVVWPADVEVVTRAWAQIAESTSQTTTYRVLCKNGTCKWTETTSQPVFDEQGRVSEIQVASRDITERKLAEESLQALAELRADQVKAAEALDEASAALAQSLEPVYLYEIILRQMARVVPCDTAHIYEYKDGYAVTVGGHGQPHLPAGVRVAPLEGSQGLFPLAGDQARLVAETRGAPGWRNIPPWTGRHELRSIILLPLLIQGKLYGCLRVSSFTPGFYHQEHFQVARAFAERIAQALWNARLYQLEQHRARAAEELASLRNDFVASVSHELRTPLAAMLGYGELLQAHWDRMSDTDRRAKVDRIVVAANRQRKLVEDLLRETSLEESAPVLSRKPLSLADTVTRAAHTVRETYLGQTIEATGPANLMVLADPIQTEQILINLVDNAAKYSPEGSPVLISWSLEGIIAAVRVRDKGPGIPTEGREILFTRFGRVPGSRMRAGRVGTGLGLYLSRAFATAMGGSLDLEATGTDGSTFTLRLPACTD
jgi:PAS domain S-box-containing protein